MKSAFFLLLDMVIIAGAFWFAPQVTASEPLTLPPFSQFSGVDNELSKSLRLAQFNNSFRQAVQSRAESALFHSSLQRKIEQQPAGQKIAAFIDMLNKAEAESPVPYSQLQQYLSQPRLLKGNAGGSIAGQVTVNGIAVFDPVEILAFDAHGFPAAATTAEVGTGNYSLNVLAAGSYYVVTRSQYVDEFHDNIPSNQFRRWRDASLITVADNITSIVNFDLETGATITGTIFNADGTTPLAFSSVNFEITVASEPGISFGSSAFTDADGRYSIAIPVTGGVKIIAGLSGGGSQFYDHKAGLFEADVVNIPSLDAEIGGIDFTIPEASVTPREGSVIQGTVRGPDAEPVAFAFVFSFNVADTSISGFTLTSFEGGYALTGLNAGTHIVYANHFLDALIPPAVEGEYYSDAKTPSLATPLMTTGLDTLSGIDFSLDAGGEINGQISDANGTPLGDVAVVAFKSDVIAALLTSPSLLLLSEVDFGIGVSDSVGTYSIPGLSSGNYILRTISLLKESGAPILDEYYGGGQSLYDFLSASPVLVIAPNITGDINFDLDPGAVIAGHFLETDGITPVDGLGSVFALNAGTGLPELAFPVYNSADGSYTLAPLPTGEFNLFAFVSQVDSGSGLFDPAGLGKTNLVRDEHPVYLPQFYNGKATVEDADPVSVAAPAVTPDINFKMVRAASIYGTVNLPTGSPVGADTLEALMVVAYDAETGVVAGGTETTFAGGYKVRGLPPGRSYKVATLPATNGYAATYYGGGASFDSPDAAVVAVIPDDFIRADIQIVAGEGSVSGSVTDSNGQPLSGVLVLAYDLTGHAVSAGLSGFEVHNNYPTGDPSAYKIEGLLPGQYYLRTVSLFRFLQLLNEPDSDSGGLGEDPFSMIFALLGIGSDLGGSLDLDLHADQWYDSQPISFDLGNLDIFSLLLGLITSEGNPDLLLPLHAVAPSGAQAVVVSGTTPGIDFVLSPATLSPVSVEENRTSVPDGFELSQNYPNPFNPSTQFTLSVPQASEVQVTIYNALGQRIRTLFDGFRSAGTYTLRWDSLDSNGLPVSSGIYLVRMETRGTNLSRKMLLVR